MADTKGTKDKKALISQGKKNMELAEGSMAALMDLRKRFKNSQTFKGVRIGMALHVTKETGVLVRTLIEGGADVAITSCNPLSTQDDVAEALRSEGIKVYGYKGESREDYYKFLRKVVSFKPQITIDDGCDLVTEIHNNHRKLIPKIIGGCEETTTGVIRLKAMELANELAYPIIAVNDNRTKHLMDNYYGTGQSTFDGILRSSNVLIAGKTVVVAGYGSCGKGVALRAKGMGANVIVTEINPFCALQAAMDGYRVMPMSQAAKEGDIFITVTGNIDVIRAEHIKQMKDGAILANSGHFDVEINLKDLAKLSSRKRNVRPHLDEYVISVQSSAARSAARGGSGKTGTSGTAGKTGKKIFLAAEGRLVNLAAAEGHPSEVMAMSFCGQVLAAEYLVKLGGNLPPRVYTLPDGIDQQISRLQLKDMGINIDSLTDRQIEYMQTWQEGT